MHVDVPCRLMLLDPRYLRTELLEELNKLTSDELPAALAGHVGNVLKSISRLECYATGNVDRDGVSFTLNHYITAIIMMNIVYFCEYALIYKHCKI